MPTYTLKSWNGFTTAIHLNLSDPPTREQIRDLAHRYRMRVKDVRRGLFKERDGKPVWGAPPPPWEDR